ncbi:hypothetical protein [Streptomyces sp. NPDC048720]|uniref:hypothetical protein n=1 Tax=Streptomyces sp. NPDC048720 TaxID=3365588 RepID=UPI003721A6D2
MIRTVPEPLVPLRLATFGWSRHGYGAPGAGAVLVIHNVADVAAAFPGLWIVLHLPKALGHGIAMRLRRF